VITEDTDNNGGGGDEVMMAVMMISNLMEYNARTLLLFT
jgi:hypothetical protein